MLSDDTYIKKQFVISLKVSVLRPFTNVKEHKKLNANIIFIMKIIRT